MTNPNDPARLIAPGFSLEDAVMQAFEETINGPRYWNPGKYPKIYFHVQYAVRSIISNRLEKSETKKTVIWQNAGPDDERTEDEILSEMGALELAEKLNDAVTDDVASAKVCSEVIEALSGEPLLEKLYDLLADGLPPRKIAEQMGLSRLQIYNLKKLLMRRLKNSPHIAKLAATKRSKINKEEIL